MQQESLESDRVLNNISAVVLNGSQQILNQVYDSIGFNKIKDEVLKGWQDDRIPDNSRAVGQCRRIPSVLLHLQWRTIRGSHNDSHHR